MTLLFRSSYSFNISMRSNKPITFMWYVGLLVYFSERNFVFNFGRECKCTTAKVHGDRHIERAIVPGNQSSIELSFPGAKSLGAKGPENELVREREGQGAKVPGSELARVLLADSLRERIGPGAKRLGTNQPAISFCILINKYYWSK